MMAARSALECGGSRRRFSINSQQWFVGITITKKRSGGLFGARPFLVLGTGGKRWLLPPHSKTLREPIAPGVFLRERCPCDRLANFPDSWRLPQYSKALRANFAADSSLKGR